MDAQALICDAQRQFALREVTLPDPGPHDVVIRTLWSGVSIGTEFMMVRSTLDRVFYPLCTGYTATGVVESGGAEVAGYAAGDLVYFRTSPGMLLDGEPVCTSGGTHCSHSVIDARLPGTAPPPRPACRSTWPAPSCCRASGCTASTSATRGWETRCWCSASASWACRS